MRTKLMTTINRIFILRIMVIGASLVFSSVYAQPIPSPTLAIPSPTLANNCAGCHGTMGYSAEPMPIIAGLSETYFKQTMREFKSGKRPDTIMSRIARGYSDKDIDEMAAFFASQHWISPDQEVDPVQVEKGGKIHQAKCEACHKDNGRHQDAATPRIAGQWRRYLEIVLNDYWREDRKMPNFFMTTIVNTLSPSDITALANFYANER